jgi:hypothetical protein
VSDACATCRGAGTIIHNTGGGSGTYSHGQYSMPCPTCRPDEAWPWRGVVDIPPVDHDAIIRELTAESRLLIAECDRLRAIVRELISAAEVFDYSGPGATWHGVRGGGMDSVTIYRDEVDALHAALEAAKKECP